MMVWSRAACAQVIRQHLNNRCLVTVAALSTLDGLRIGGHRSTTVGRLIISLIMSLSSKQREEHRISMSDIHPHRKRTNCRPVERRRSPTDWANFLWRARAFGGSDTKEAESPQIEPPQSRSGFSELEENFHIIDMEMTAVLRSNAPCVVSPKCSQTKIEA